jgi:tetratricopeptide (TPR) repeat protein
MVAFLQARLGPDAPCKPLPEGEWGRLLRAAQAERAAGKQAGRPPRPGTAANRLSARPAPSAAPARECAPVIPIASRGPLIGRDAELALLAELVDGIASGRGGVVLVDGEPGIGKSALVQSALTRVTSLGGQVFWGTGGELDQALPLQPLLDALRVRETAAGPRREAMARVLRGEVVMDRGMDGPAVLAEQLLALIAEECAARPTVLVIDDLHWADQATIRLMARLAGSARDLPLLLIGTVRPTPQRDDLLTLRRAAGDATRLQLSGLADPAVAQLVAGLAGGTPDRHLLWLASDAAGNPLYITELVAALARASALAITGEGHVILRAGTAPRSLAAAIADRLGFISGPVREVLQSAVLLGVEFDVTDLATLQHRSIADLAKALQEACTAGVLTESGNRLRFRHPLIHAALYEQLPVPVRAAWHGEAARALATAGAPADRVARQLLLETGEPASTPEPMQEWMVSWLADSAELLVSQAPQAAAVLLTRALASIPASQTLRGRLAARLADALYSTGDRATAEQVANQALEQATDPDLLVDLHWTLAQCRMMAGQPAESLATLSKVLGSPGLSARHRGRLLVVVARAHYNSGELEKADQAAASALAAASQNDDKWAMAWAMMVMGFVATGLGRLAEALVLYDRGLAVTQADPALNDLRLLIQMNKAVPLGNLGRYTEAFATADQARRLAGLVGTTIRLAQANDIVGQVLFETGRWDEALAQASIVPESLKEPSVACDERGIAATVSFHRGDTAAARGHLSAAVPHVQRMGHRLVPPLALARSLDLEQDGAIPEALAALTDWLGGNTEELGSAQDLIPDAMRLAMLLGDQEAARGIASLAVQSARQSQAPYRQANALYCQGLLDHAVPLLHTAAACYRDASRPLQRAMALEAAASEHARAGDPEQARAALASAIEIFTSLGAIADVTRCKCSQEPEEQPR